MIRTLIKKIFKNECEFPEFIFYHHVWTTRNKKNNGYDGWECLHCGERSYAVEKPKGGWL